MKRMYVIIAIAALSVALYAGGALGGSSCTETHNEVGSMIYCLTLGWTAHTDSTFADYTTTTTLVGEILEVVTDPDTSAAGETPSDNYDIYLRTQLGEDIMGGALANRDSLDTERARPKSSNNLDYSPVVNDKLVLDIDNIDRSAVRGTVYIYYRKR